MAGLIKWKRDVFVFSYQTYFCNLCENGIKIIEVTEEEKRIGPNYLKLIKRFVY